MKNKKLIGSIGTLLILSLFAVLFTLIFPLQENPADGKHECIEVETIITRNADGHIVVVDLKSKGHNVFHFIQGHQPHPFDCNQNE